MISLEGEIVQPMLTLNETETIFILSLDSSIVASDSKDIESIKKENERYVEVKNLNKIIKISSYLTYVYIYIYICVYLVM